MKNTVKNALQSAFSLLSNEVESIELDELKKEYLLVIYKIEMALNKIDE